MISITDLFCGAGGSSIGAEIAGGTLRLGLNHWDRAIETHAANFQHADHDCEDVSSLTTAQIRRYPDSDILLASPECTNHSLAKGARRRKPQAASLFEDGPGSDSEQDRSRATMWDVVRFAEQKILKGKPYKAIIVENVVDAFNWGPDDSGSLFDAWLIAMDGLGYQHETVWLNSMFAGPVPQSRDRMYVVFWRKGMRTPNLQVEPQSWCPACEEITKGQQAFKRGRRGRPWGRYGPQYLFVCPSCGGTALPGAFPAANAIDWTLPAELIGDRQKPLAESTRDRIRRGLERLAREPFAIRIGGNGNPRPLTLPLITLTARHEMAMVLPVAGNTFERTEGNRARDASTQALDTVHATLDRAMVMPPHGAVEGRDATQAPGPTQTTTSRSALVLSNRMHNVPRAAEREPSHPVLTGGHLAVVVRNNRDEAGEQTTPIHEPIRTLTGGCHQSLVIPYDSTSQPKATESEPVPTLSTRDRVALVVPYTNNGRCRDADLDVMPTVASEGPPAVVLSDDEIDACRFRMFDLPEIAEAMAMARHVDGTDYLVLGNKRERMAQYGNAVTPPAMELLVGRLLEIL